MFILRADMNGRLHRHDKLGLTERWYEVPEQVPTRARDPDELRKDMFRHMDIQQQWSQFEARNGQHRRSWPNRRRDQKGKSNQEAAERA